MPKQGNHCQVIPRVRVLAGPPPEPGELPPVAGEATAGGDRLVSGEEMFSGRVARYLCHHSTTKADVAAEWLSTPPVFEVVADVVGSAVGYTDCFAVVAAASMPLLGAPMLSGGSVPRRAGLLSTETLL